MAWYKPAIRRAIARYRKGGSSNSAMPKVNRVILHTAVTNADSLYPSMSRPGTATSHFYVRKNGKVEQYVNTAFRSSANLDGNHDSITIETWDGYPNGWANGSDVPKWTRRQVKALAKLLAWAHQVHGVPLHALSSSKPGTRGIGWHRQGIDPWRVPGGEYWSKSGGKVCPGDRRVKQIPAIIRKARKLAGKQEPKHEPKHPKGNNLTFPKAPRGWKAAIGTAKRYARDGRGVTVGMCLRETRQYYGVPSKFPAAINSLQDARSHGKAYRVDNWSKVPKGAIVYWSGGGSKYGHVAISIGGGYVISTDWPRGRYGKVHGATLMRSWGYTDAYWSPLVNTHRVWPRHDLYGKPKSKPKHNNLKARKRVNRVRVNRTLRGGPLKKEDRLQLNALVNALRTHGYTVKGYKKHPRASARRAVRKFQSNQGWTGADADGLLGPTTCERLGLKSFTRKLKKHHKPKHKKMKARKRVNRNRVNRTLRGGPLRREDRLQLNAVVLALREKQGRKAAKGYAKYPRASARRAIRKFQRKQGWRGKDADGLLGPATCERLGLPSFSRKFKK